MRRALTLPEPFEGEPSARPTRRDVESASLLSRSAKVDLDQFPFDLANPAAQALLETLVLAIPEEPSVKLLSRKAGVLIGRVPFSHGIEIVWASLLEAAAAQARLRPLLQALLKDQAIAAYHPKIRALTGL